MVLGALFYGFIKSVLFNVWIVCTMLVIGGFVLLWIDRLDLKPRYHDATKFSLPMYLGIGVVQCLSMVPGVSRSGAIDRRRDAVRRRQTGGDGIFILAGDADNGRRIRFRSVQEPARTRWQQLADYRYRFCGVVRLRLVRGQDAAWLRLAARFCAVRLVADRRRRARLDPVGHRSVSWVLAMDLQQYVIFCHLLVRLARIAGTLRISMSKADASTGDTKTDPWLYD